MSINLEEDKVDSLANTNDMKELSEQVIKLRTLEDKFAAKEEELKKTKNDMDVLSGEVIPTMMTEMNISKFSLSDGAGVEVKPVYGASIPKAKQEEAFNWLRNNGLGILLKMRLPFPLVVTRITRQQIMLSLRKVMDINPPRS